MSRFVFRPSGSGGRKPSQEETAKRQAARNGNLPRKKEAAVRKAHTARKENPARKAKAAQKKTERPSKRKTQRSSLMGYYSFEDGSPTAQRVGTWLRDQDVTAPVVAHSSGSGFVATLGRLVIDSSGSGLSGTVPHGGASHGEGTLSYDGRQGQLSAGVALINTRRLRIYPLVGLGGSGGRFGDRLAGDAPPAELRGWGAGQATVGIGMDLLLSFWLFHLLIGLRAGVGTELFSMQFGDGDTVTADAGLFFRVVVGGGLGRR